MVQDIQVLFNIVQPHLSTEQKNQQIKKYIHSEKWFYTDIMFILNRREQTAIFKMIHSENLKDLDYKRN